MQSSSRSSRCGFTNQLKQRINAKYLYPNFGSNNVGDKVQLEVKEVKKVGRRYQI